MAGSVEAAAALGRPPDMIRFKAERGCLIAAQISATELRLLLTDLNGRELGARAPWRCDGTRARERSSVACCDGVRALLERSGQNRGTLLAMGGGRAGDH